MATVTEGSEVPIIDMYGFLGHGDTTEIVDSIREACENVGFFMVRNHGIPESLPNNLITIMDKAFSLPMDELRSLASPTQHPFRGVEVLSGGDSVPAVFRLQACRFDDAADAGGHGVPAQYHDFFHPNVWPTHDTEFRSQWNEYMDATRHLGNQIMRLFALALELPIDYFDPMLTLDASTMSVNYYPPQQLLSSETEEHVTLNAHEDSGMLTVLYQTGDYTGLQLLTKEGSWVEVPLIPDTFVINIGNLMSRWTNGRWKSTTHRVVASKTAAQSRYSVPTFYLPNVDTVIEPLENCIGDEGPQFDPVTAYEWERQYLRRYEAYRQQKDMVAK